MAGIQRRELLAGVGLGLGISLAGCSALDRSEDSPNEAKVSYVNVSISHEQSHTVDLLILEDETPVYMQSKTFEGNPDPDDLYSIGGGHFEDLPEEAGEYVIWLQLDGTRWNTFDMSKWDMLPTVWREGEFPNAIGVGYSIATLNPENESPEVSLSIFNDDPGTNQ